MPEGSWTPQRGLGWLGVIVALLAVLFLFRAPLVTAMHRIDQRWLGETVIDTLSRLRGDEDWAQIEPLAGTPDYRWLFASPAPVRIAHALGEGSRPGGNTLEALRHSAQRGLKHFEVDLWLDGGRVRCHHGPAAPLPFKVGDCELGLLLQALPPDGWLILDIKTDFVATGAIALALAAASGRNGQMVFQLYKPWHLRQFNLWHAAYPELPGPLVTAYLAHRALRHVAVHVRQAGVAVLTAPLHRLPAYADREPGLALFVHPVHDCEALEAARRAAVQGLYQLSGLECSP